MESLKVGDTVILVGCNRKAPVNRTVLSVGHKLATLDNGEKIDKNTLQLRREPYGDRYFTEAGYLEDQLRARVRDQLDALAGKTTLLSSGNLHDLSAALGRAWDRYVAEKAHDGAITAKG